MHNFPGDNVGPQAQVEAKEIVRPADVPTGSWSPPFQPAKRSDDDTICLYPSKKCTNPRAVKKNGELHTMCEYHRIRANENQRRLERRRKAALRSVVSNEIATSAPPSLWAHRGFPEPIPVHPMEGVSPNLRAVMQEHAIDAPWHPMDLEILQACLFDDAPHDSGADEEPLAGGAVMPAASPNCVDLSQLRLGEPV
ncbi:hypothetical protein PINS_up003707 [Pythium insidiosum]|nr:hypothetical protein PINS_up003707 [Pythium insidiosum]